MKKSQKIKWGIIGAGRIAAKFASDLSTSKNGELIAVASTSLHRAQDFALKFNAEHAFGTYEEIFSTEVEAIYIATPHTFHKEHTLMCLERGIAVLCEKPFGMNEEEVIEMISMAREKKVFLMEALWTRFIPSTLKTLELIESGAIGEVVTIHADFGFSAEYDPEARLFNMKLGGGAFLDIGIYPAFLSLLILGYPSRIQATSTFSPTGSDVTTSFIYAYDNSATAVLNCTVASETLSEAVIYGTKGHIVLHKRFHEARKLTLIQAGKEEQVFDFSRETFGYDYEIEEVNQCLLQGKTESELMPLSFSQKLIHLLDRTREAAGIHY
ncbi:MAG: Gfo/Idh/MocA family oxidoreductase [Cytophagaceae bacterium]|nr:Gfo/Idh/MocA family oxidoreductase [Cytophagaceae bacterium]MBK9934705.1 Gfo/Idh/MocA family oxidoreductase [Cytophagaceae bacterium]MBL0301142.1 Gfo/Idh/MocA family oxidoreductase [Cytophagaceae bacterium]MBL0323960.1 Gfo/Idh/MocA family oxidoreductase [Cytophagaceae bacterium]